MKCDSHNQTFMRRGGGWSQIFEKCQTYTEKKNQKCHFSQNETYLIIKVYFLARKISNPINRSLQTQ